MPDVSIVIPVYNEEGILHSSVVDLVTSLDELGWDYELLLAENGSSDRTVALGEELSKKYPRVSIHSLGEPNYGKALKEGIRRARGRFVICDEIDLCDTDFYQRAYFLTTAARNPNNWVRLHNVNTSWAGFGQASYTFNDRLTVTGGVRYTKDTKTTDLLKTAEIG